MSDRKTGQDLPSCHFFAPGYSHFKQYIPDETERDVTDHRDTYNWIFTSNYVPPQEGF